MIACLWKEILFLFCKKISVQYVWKLPRKSSPFNKNTRWRYLIVTGVIQLMAFMQPAKDLSFLQQVTSLGLFTTPFSIDEKQWSIWNLIWVERLKTSSCSCSASNKAKWTAHSKEEFMSIMPNVKVTKFKHAGLHILTHHSALPCNPTQVVQRLIWSEELATTNKLRHDNKFCLDDTKEPEAKNPQILNCSPFRNNCHMPFVFLLKCRIAYMYSSIKYVHGTTHTVDIQLELWMAFFKYCLVSFGHIQKSK